MEYIISNQTILSTLSPRAIKIYNFLLEKANRITNSSFWRRSKIAAACAMSESTFARALRELKAAKLVAVQERYESCGRQKSNEYFLLGKTCTLNMPSVALLKPLKGNTLKVYLYLDKRCGTGSYRIAMRDISDSCNIAMKTAQKCIAFLKRYSYIQAESQSCLEIFGSCATGYNLYSICKSKRRSTFQRILCALLISAVTPSPTSTVTPHLTLSKLKLTNKKKIGDVSLGGYIQLPNENEGKPGLPAKPTSENQRKGFGTSRFFESLRNFPAFLFRFFHFQD